MFKVTQTWGPTDTFAGKEANPPEHFKSLDAAKEYILAEMEADKISGYDVIYSLFKGSWIECKYKVDIRILN